MDFPHDLQKNRAIIRKLFLSKIKQNNKVHLPKSLPSHLVKFAKRFIAKPNAEHKTFQFYIFLVVFTISVEVEMPLGPNTACSKRLIRLSKSKLLGLRISTFGLLERA